MNEQAFRRWLESQPHYRRSAVRARRLGREYDGCKTVIERVREFEGYLARNRGGGSVDLASEEEAAAFVAWFAKARHVSEGACRGALASYYRFTANEELAAALDRMGHDFLSRFVAAKKLVKRLEASDLKTLADILPGSRRLPPDTLERCYQAILGRDPERIEAFAAMIRARSREVPGSLLDLVRPIDSRRGAQEVRKILRIAPMELRLLLGLLDSALAAPAPKTVIHAFPPATALDLRQEARFRRLHALLTSLFLTSTRDPADQHATAYRRRVLYNVLWLFASLGRLVGTGKGYLAMDGRQFMKERQKKNLNTWRRYFKLCTECHQCRACDFVAGHGVAMDAVTPDGRRCREFGGDGDFELRLSFGAKAGGREALTVLQEYAGLLVQRYGAKAAVRFSRVSMEVIASA